MRWALLVTGALVGGCSSTPSEPSATGDQLILLKGTSTNIYFVSAGESPRVDRLSLAGGALEFHERGFVNRQQNALFVSLIDFGPTGHRRLVRLDLTSRTLDWEVPTTSELRRIDIDGVEFSGSLALSGSRDGNHLFVRAYLRDDFAVTGAAVLDAATGAFIRFIRGPQIVSVGGFRPIPLGSSFSPGGVAALMGDSKVGAHAIGNLDPSESRIVDSIALPLSETFPGDRIQGFVFAPGGGAVYLLGLAGIYRMDLSARTITNRISPPSRGSVSVSPDGTRVLITDGGVWPDFPGSGQVFVFDASLQPLPPIDLGVDPVTGGKTRSAGVAWSDDSRLAYITTGSAEIGPLFAPQRSRLLVVDVASRTIVREIPLNDFNVSQVLRQ